MRAPEGFTATFAAAGTKALVDAQGEGPKGGTYLLMGVSSNWNSGNAQLQVLGPDGSTYVNVGTALSANGSQVVYLPPGAAQVVLTTTTAATIGIRRIPGE